MLHRLAPVVSPPRSLASPSSRHCFTVSRPLPHRLATVASPSGDLCLTVWRPLSRRLALAVSPSGALVSPPGSLVSPSGTLFSPSGALGSPRGTLVSPPGALVSPSGTLVSPSGVLAPTSGAAVPRPGSTVPSSDLAPECHCFLGPLLSWDALSPSWSEVYLSRIMVAPLSTVVCGAVVLPVRPWPWLAFFCVLRP